MTSVELTPFGRQLLGITMGAVAHHNKLSQANITALKQKHQALVKHQEENQMWEDFSYNTTIAVIDKRFKESKAFVATGEPNDQLRFKKSAGENEKRLQYIAQKNVLKTRARYESQVSNYNKMIMDKKMRSAVKTLDLKSL